MERGPEEVVLRAVRLPEGMSGLFDRIEAFGPARLGCGDASCRIEVDARWRRVPAPARRLALVAADAPQHSPARLEADPRHWARGFALEILSPRGAVWRRLQFHDARGQTVLTLEWRAPVPPLAWERLLACGTEGLAWAAPTGFEALPAARGDVDPAWRQGCDIEALHQILHEARQQRLALQAEVGGEAARLQVGFMPEQVALCMRRRRLTVQGEALVWQLDEMRLAGLELVGHASARGLHQRLELGGPGGERLARLGPAGSADRGDPCGWRLALQQVLS
ncbi:hypothetical protein X805_09530 [Sphaerotilus natans subsp. natans DSM 6575]|uniref:Uncharacterized protein n=1 Tax=Sphaerotilus natans subsp. natans DSM 6575 TaxID=1286631 RepID=A0A059KQY2_9BURK|nr:hypothetical protein [Sphaerotilus natans]KDB53498.1 hypothetical protein X805_09530 [Sphaerotilus natans subsp. natans DSM 6575]SIQ86123.1 hypothetical protein SAMN05421778_10569 [Sphaerotilus natans]